MIHKKAKQTIWVCLAHICAHACVPNLLPCCTQHSQVALVSPLGVLLGGGEEFLAPKGHDYYVCLLRGTALLQKRSMKRNRRTEQRPVDDVRSKCGARVCRANIELLTIQESYAVRNPRDYKKNPPKGAELEHINLFRQACLMTKETLDAEKPETTPTVSVFPPRPKYLMKEEALALLTDYRKRYKAQLPSTRGTRPDPQAPIDKTTRTPKRYFRLDNFLSRLIASNDFFIRSMVYQSLKAQQNTQQLVD